MSTNIKFDLSPLCIVKGYYPFTQQVTDVRLKSIMSTSVVISTIKEYKCHEIYGKPFDMKLKFISGLRGIELDHEIIDNGLIQSMIFQNYGRAKIPDKDLTNVWIEIIDEILKDKVYTPLINKLNELLNEILGTKTVRNALAERDYIFNAPLFWQLWKLESIGTFIQSWEYIAAMMFDGEPHDLMHQTVDIVGKRLESVRVHGGNLYLMNPLIDIYYSDVKEKVKHRHTDVIQIYTRVKIGWYDQKIADVQPHMQDIISDFLFESSSHILACHTNMRINHIHFHVFNTLEDILTYQLWNIIRTWKAWFNLQGTAPVPLNTRWTYNFLTNANDIRMFTFMIICAMPPPKNFLDVKITSIDQMESNFLSQYDDTVMLHILKKLSHINMPQAHLYVWDLAYISYVVDGLDVSGNDNLTKQTVTITFKDININTVATPDSVYTKKVVVWEELPVDDTHDLRLGPQDLRHVGAYANYVGRIASITDEQLFSVHPLRLRVESGIKEDMLPDLLNANPQLDYISYYRNPTKWSQRNSLSTLNTGHGKLTVKDIFKIVVGEGTDILVNEYHMLMKMSMLVDEPAIRLPTAKLSVLNENVKFVKSFVHSDIKEMACIIYAFKKVFRLSTVESMLSFLNSPLKIYFVGAIEENMIPALKRVLPYASVTGAGKNAVSPNKRTDIRFQITRSAYDFVFCDVDQSKQLTMEEIMDWFFWCVNYCLDACVKACIVKCQYTSMEILVELFKRERELRKWTATILKPGFDGTVSAETYVLIQSGYSDEQYMEFNPELYMLTETYWQDFRLDVPYFGSMMPIETITASEFLNISNYLEGKNAVICVGCGIAKFHTLLSICLNVCSQVTTGRVAENSDVIVLKGIISELRKILFMRANRLLALQTDIDELRINNVGLMSNIDEQRYFGAPLTEAGYYNWATKVKVARIVEKFRCIVHNGRPMNVVQIAGGKGEDLLSTIPDDIVTIIDPNPLPEANKFNIRAVAKEFDFNNMRGILREADVIQLTFGIHNIYNSSGPNSITLFLRDLITQYLVGNVDQKRDRKRLFIVNFYAHEGAVSLYHYLAAGNSMRNVRWQYRDDEGNIIDTYDHLDKVDLEAQADISFGRYCPVETIMMDDILKLSWKDANLEPRVSSDDKIYNWFFVSQADLITAIDKGGLGNPVWTSNLLFMMNMMSPLLVCGLTEGDLARECTIEGCSGISMMDALSCRKLGGG